MQGSVPRTKLEVEHVTTPPRVSIVMPLFNDEERVAAALESCLAQSLSNIEILAIDDASTDGTVAIVQEYQRKDDRIRLIRQPENRSAFQARRVGVVAASAPYVLFVDGDDELAPHAAQTSLAKAQQTGADVVGFGVDVITTPGESPTRLQATLQPQHTQIARPHIIPSLFPAGVPPQGHLWRYLFSTEILRDAYEGLGEDVAYHRANDLPVTFLALAAAKKYVSVPDQLYRYYFRRGTSGHAIKSVEHFAFLLSGVRPITDIAPHVVKIADHSPTSAELIDSYESARLQVIGSVLRYCIRDTSGDLQRACLTMLVDEVDLLDTVRAAAIACPEALLGLSGLVEQPAESAPVRNIMLTTRRLDTGGLQAVVMEQARQLSAVGYHITVAVSQKTEGSIDVPPGVVVVYLNEGSTLEQIDRWVSLCRERHIDMIIDHYMLYNDTWPWTALSAFALGVPTIGWLHSFALRPLFDQTRRVSFISSHASMLRCLVTLSPTDVAFWKLCGIERTVYLPNPVSTFVHDALENAEPRTLSPGRIKLAWWGRIDSSIKQVHHLVEMASHLRARNMDFRLTIIGPDSGDLTAAEVRQSATLLGVDDDVELLGDLTPGRLLAALRDADLLVSASAIEGFQLTIIEAQALAIPVVMYDLPWLTTVRENGGLISTSPDEPRALADAVIEIAEHPESYTQLSHAALEFAQSAANIDVGALTVDLISGELSGEFSPEPRIEDARDLTQLLVRFSERNTSDEARGPRAEIIALRRERDRAQGMLRQVMEGPSFKIGRALTRLPRKARDLVRPKKKKSSRFVTAPGSLLAPPPPLKASVDAPLPTRSDNPDVTFVIPVYNSAAWLDDCLSSVLAQSGLAIEVICIDDGSTDESLTILERFAASDPRVSVIIQANSGQSVARNRGLEAASGRYTIYLDSDDYWPYDALAALVRRADEESLDLLLFDCAAFLEGDVDEKTWRWYSTYYQRAQEYREVRSGVNLMTDMRRRKEYRPHVGLYMSRTSFVRDAGVRFIPGIVHQDNPYTFRLLLNATRAAHARVDAYARRIRPGSTITTLTPERSARGYYLSYLEMMRELNVNPIQAGSAEIVGNIVDSVYEGARKQFALISEGSADDIRSLDSSADAQIVFESLMTAVRPEAAN